MSLFILNIATYNASGLHAKGALPGTVSKMTPQNKDDSKV